MGKNEVMSGLALILGSRPPRITKADRIVIQKLVYLLKSMKNSPAWSSDYHFGWYINGPYSSGLANDYYSDESEERITFEDNSSMRQMSEFLGEEKNSSNELELFASIIYQIKENPELKKDKESIAEKICRSKPKYTKERVTCAYSKIIESRLFKI